MEKQKNAMGQGVPKIDHEAKKNLKNFEIDANRKKTAKKLGKKTVALVVTSPVI